MFKDNPNLEPKFTEISHEVKRTYVWSTSLRIEIFDPEKMLETDIVTCIIDKAGTSHYIKHDYSALIVETKT